MPTARRCMDKATLNMRLVDGFREWLTESTKQLSPHTVQSYCTAVRQFAGFMGNTNLLKTQRANVSDWLQYMIDYRRVSAATAASALYALRKFDKFLGLGGVTSAYPAYKIPVRKVPSRLVKPLTQEQVCLLLRGTKKPRDLAIVELFYASGVRCNELRMMNIEDVYFDADLDGGSATVRQGKGGKDRVTIIGRYAVQALGTYLAGRQTGPLFLHEPRHQRGGVTRDHCGNWLGQWREFDAERNRRILKTVRLGDFKLPTKEAARQSLDTFLKDKLPSPPPAGRITVRSIERIIGQAARRAGLGDVHPHQLRHSFATHLLNSGADVIYVSQLLGHANVGVTAKYLHVAIEDLIRIHGKFHPQGDNYA